MFLTADRRKAQRGQVLPIGAVALVILIGIAGLAIDGGHDYYVHRSAQNAADLAALAAGKVLANSGTLLTGPLTAGSKVAVAAHDFAAFNGFTTNLNNTCETAGANSYSNTWFDVGGLACNAAGGFTTKVQINSPPVAVGGTAVPTQCTGTTQFHCIQIVVTARIQHFFMGALGIPNGTTVNSAIVFALPPGSSYQTPPPVAVYLYEPQSGCVLAVQQCFNEALVPSRSNLSCTGGNCPTLWITGSAPAWIKGIDGATLPNPADWTTVQSAGDSVLQGSVAFCDPYNGVSCKNVFTATGAKGFAMAGGSKLYCSAYGGGGVSGGNNCTTTGQAGATGQIIANGTAYSALNWTPTMQNMNLPDCGALVLNGDTVANSFLVAPSSMSACTNTNEPYVIQPGIYKYIVINHGNYVFEQGMYDITATAPVNTNAVSGYKANGIDHSLETATDFDLCTGGLPASCPTLTAGVWIGHGGGWFGAQSAGTAGTPCSGGNSTAVAGGGGDKTEVSGAGVTFRLESTSGGFVTTNETTGVKMTAAGIGSAGYYYGTPMLIDLENSSFVHLDGSASWDHNEGNGNGRTQNQFTGLIYQPNTIKGGGVELNPQMNQRSLPPFIGQIFAYSFTTIGNYVGIAPAIDFSQGYGATNSPIISSGFQEASLISSVTLVKATDSSGNPIAGMETLVVTYSDEWALDAYATYVKVNNGNPVFFSQGVWNPVPGANQPQPPATNTPGDSNPARPNTASPSPYTAALDPVTNLNTDWKLSIPNGTATNSTFETSGNWAWGHERDLANATPGPNTATIKYTFPTPAGSSVTITMFITDGDRCGDYALSSVTLNNIGTPYSGGQGVGSVRLMQ